MKIILSFKYDYCYFLFPIVLAIFYEQISRSEARTFFDNEAFKFMINKINSLEIYLERESID